MKTSSDASKFVNPHVICQMLNIQNPKIGNVNNSLNACRSIFVTKLTVVKMAKELLPFYEAKVPIT